MKGNGNHCTGGKKSLRLEEHEQKKETLIMQPLNLISHLRYFPPTFPSELNFL